MFKMFKNRMAIGVAVAVIALAGVALVATAGGANVTKYKSSGDWAQCYEQEYLDHRVNAYVSETGKGKDRSVYLSYSVYDYTTTPYTYSYGSGQIAVGDYKPTGNGGTLKTDTADMTGGYKYGDDVEIDLTWKKDGSYWYTNTGHTVYHYPTYKRTTNGQSTRFNAECSGTIGGYTVPDANADYHYGYAGSNKNMTITIEKN